MARISRLAELAQQRALAPVQMLGRAPNCRLRDDDHHVSSHHAELRWDGHQWLIEDLGSTNGTWLDGKRLSARSPAVLRLSGQVGLGRPDNVWTLTCDAAPRAMAEAPDGSVVEDQNGVLALHDADNPELVVYQSHEGEWVMDSDQGTRPVHSTQVVVTSLGPRTLYLPDVVVQTLDRGAIPPLPGTIGLRIEVSTDGTHTNTTAILSGESFAVAPRANHSVLQLLARARAADREDSLPEADQGWLRPDEIQETLGISDSNLYVAIFRLRKQFEALGVVEAMGVVERRMNPSQIRLGVPDVVVIDR